MALNTGLNTISWRSANFPTGNRTYATSSNDMVNTANRDAIATSMGGGPAGQQVSPALAAMGQTNTATRGPGISSTTTTTPPTVDPPRTDLVTPTRVDTARQDQIYADQLAQSDRDRTTMLDVGQRTISALQRRNASNAALSGFSVGGGSYLGGQRAAASAGINAFNQGLLNWGAQRQGIMGQGAGLASNAASQNAAIANQGNIFNATREGNVQDRIATTEATRTAQTLENTITGFGADLKQYGIDTSNRTGVTNAIAADLINQLQSAEPNSSAYTAALQRMEAYKSKLAQAKNEFNSSTGQAPAFYKDTDNHPGSAKFDDYLRWLEKQGFFNGV